MTTRPPRYRAYLLRLWDANPRGPPAWHASLEDAHTGERRGFADLEQLLAFLTAAIGDGRNAEDGAAPPVEED